MYACTFGIAVIMERTKVDNKWLPEKWEAQGVVQDIFAPGAQARVLFDDGERKQILYPGFLLELNVREAENYYLNVSSPEPKVFVLWRVEEGTPKPARATVSYGEAVRWMDADEKVDGVPMPPGLFAWVGGFVEQHYRPEPKKTRRRT